MQELKNRGFGTQVHYIPVPAHPHYRRLGCDPSGFPNAQEYYQKALSIPIYYNLEEAQQDAIVASIKDHINHSSHNPTNQQPTDKEVSSLNLVYYSPQISIC
jgi:dTDP-4-amino-4,6-dideoxygalactose transaminase